MKVFLTTAYNHPNSHRAANWLKSKSNSATFICTDNPENADVIIFVQSHPPTDPYFKKVLKHDTYKKYKRKCVLYHDADLSITPLPTISPSIEAWQYNRKHKCTAHYIARYNENKTINEASISHNTRRKYLYSFIGSATHNIRAAIIKMQHPPGVFIKDTTGLKSWTIHNNILGLYEQEYLEVIQESFFVLCPRGIGPASYRLFETMQLGRVPVIVSDEWVEIQGLEWNKFSIRISQANIYQLPEILSKRQGEAVEMGKDARLHWEKFFSPEASLEQIASSAVKLLTNKYSSIDSFKEHLQFLKNPFHFINFLRYKKNRLKMTLSHLVKNKY